MTIMYSMRHLLYGCKPQKGLSDIIAFIKSSDDKKQTSKGNRDTSGGRLIVSRSGSIFPNPDVAAFSNEKKHSCYVENPHDILDVITSRTLIIHENSTDFVVSKNCKRQIFVN